MQTFDEMYGGASGHLDVRSGYEVLKRWLDDTPGDLLDTRRQQAELLFRRIGITFAVYGDDSAEERLIPFDIIPRVLTRAEWATLERGLVQRSRALNAYLADIYGPRDCVRAGIVPPELVLQNPQFRLEMVGLPPPHGVYTHIAGIDLVRYMLENREVMMRLFPDLFACCRVMPVEGYTEALLATLRSVAPPRAQANPNIVLLTPGMYNSAFYEHSFLADKLGVELVEGSDLFVQDCVVFMRTTEGPKRVDVIYRRIDDDWLDPLMFRPDSRLGGPGLMGAYHAGNVTLCNAPGAGAADDKAIYSYMPEIVRFFTGEEPVLKNVPSWRCREPDALGHVMENLHELVVKEVNGSGGYGMLVGPTSSKDEIEAFRAKLKATPENFIAQPTLALSTWPSFVESGVAPRHVDLRPFVLTGSDEVRITPGGLTRVALKEGSLVVNSSQGGGTKDTWVLDE